MTGEIGYCDAGSAGKLAVAAPLLLAAGQAEAASSAIAAGIRDCSGQPHRIDDLASLLTLTMAAAAGWPARWSAAASLGDLAEAARH
ncbi:MAG: hypothetical protein U0P45_13020 [Acidimicrobiales bacterium]